MGWSRFIGFESSSIVRRTSSWPRSKMSFQPVQLQMPKTCLTVPAM
jgi:hypothetical protein